MTIKESIILFACLSFEYATFQSTAISSKIISIIIVSIILKLELNYLFIKILLTLGYFAITISSIK